MLTAVRIIIGYLAVRAGRRERTGRPGVWRIYRKADSIVIEVFHDRPAS